MSAVTTTYALSVQEDTFALAIIECGGNFAAAYNQAFAPEPGTKVPNAAAKARELLARPEIAKRVQQLTEAIQEHALISLGSHLVKLAEIRDLGIERGNLKVALGAEIARGQVAGFSGTGRVAPKDPNAPSEANPSVIVNIGMSPTNNQEWSAKYGRQPVVIDVEARERNAGGAVDQRVSSSAGQDRLPSDSDA